jgi:predicted ATPase
MLDAVRHLLLERPLLLIFEGLHWIDGETQALLDGLVESMDSQMRLDALPAESTGKLLDAL